MTEWLERSVGDVMPVEPTGDASDPFDGRRIRVRLFTYGDVVNTPEGTRERMAPGAISGVDISRVTVESQRHGGALVGRGESVVDTPTGPEATFLVSRTAAGDELLTLARDGVLPAASMSFHAVRNRPVAGGVIERQAIDIRRVAILERGTYPGAQVLAVRSDPDMTEDTTVAAPAPPAFPASDGAALLQRVEAQDALLQRLQAMAAVPATVPASTFSGYDSYADYAYAVRRRPDKDERNLGELLHRTQADQITTNNGGVVGQPGWVSEVQRVVSLGRRAITAMGGPVPLPPSGMEVKFPYLASANTLVAVQSTQKTEVQSARVDISAGTGALATYAGYSDISLQLLERSDPSYRDAYERIMLAAWAGVTDAAFVAAMEGASGTTAQLMGNAMGPALALTTSAHADDIFDTTPDHGFSVGDAIVFSSLTGGDATTAALVGRVVWVIATSLGAKTFRVALTPGGTAVAWGTADISAGNVHALDTTALSLRGSLAQASVAVEDATGAPATVVLAASDLFIAFAGLTDVVPAVYPGNPSNASGTFDAGSLDLNTSGLRIIRCPGVTAGKLIITNPSAARWYEQAPRFIEALDVALLGKDVGVYSYGAAPIFAPAGIVELTFV